MAEPRVIPCLLYNGSGLVKTVKFKNQTYIGDPINAIRIFNEKEVDELLLLNTAPAKKNSKLNLDLISMVASECFMPLCYGGGIRNKADARAVISLGVEKVSLNTAIVSEPGLLKELANEFGSSTIVACIDYKKNIFGKRRVTSNAGKSVSKYSPLQFAKMMDELGAGEIVLNNIDNDGVMTGYDLDTISEIAAEVEIPVIALGGAGNTDHLKSAILSGASAAAAGSMFVFQGKHKAVLINYPKEKLSFA